MVGAGLAFEDTTPHTVIAAGVRVIEVVGKSGWKTLTTLENSVHPLTLITVVL